jgi:predicted nucleic acid-binding protein
MTVFVMDSSSALKWALPEPFSDKAERLREDYHNGLIELIAPDIFSIEMIHADCPVLHAHIPLLDRAYEIAAAARIGIYDCVYVALAERENCELATADDRIIKNLQSTFPFIRSLSTFP